MLIIEEAKSNPQHLNSYIKKGKNLSILLIHVTFWLLQSLKDWKTICKVYVVFLDFQKAFNTISDLALLLFFTD